MAKDRGRKTDEVRNRVLERFLIALAVDEQLRARFSKATEREKAVILAREFKIGNNTIDALLSGQSGRVKARLRFSDQQGTPSPKPPKAAKRSNSSTSQKT